MEKVKKKKSRKSTKRKCSCFSIFLTRLQSVQIFPLNSLQMYEMNLNFNWLLTFIYLQKLSKLICLTFLLKILLIWSLVFYFVISFFIN